MATLLQKGADFGLVKSSGERYSKVIMALGWDAVRPGRSGYFGLFGGGGREIDLDVSCLMFDKVGRLIDVVWFEQPVSKDGSIRHSGDNVTGRGAGDDERIHVDLELVPKWVQTLVFTINSFSGESFEQVGNSYCRIVDATNDREVVRFALEQVSGNHTALIMARFYRQAGGWMMQSLGKPARGKTFHDMMPALSEAYL
ncbi:MAG: TerD family protein [Magnetococcales bacterium]|nr:TerD family protein [Magnetococcales bacterium]